MSRFDDPDDLPRSTSGRIPQWVFDERQGQQHAPVVDQPIDKPGVRKRIPFIVGAGALALVASFGYAGHTKILNGIPVLGDLVVQNGSSVPRPGFEEAAAPLGTPAPVPDPSPAWVPIALNDDGSPVTWSPCRPIHYVVRPDNAPPGAQEMLESAISTVSVATGLQFVNDGITDEATSTDRESFSPERYGNRWAPVLITWSTYQEAPGLMGSVAGQAGPQQVNYEGQRTYVSGQVILDADQLGAMVGAGDDQDVQNIIEHELGHLVGLDHIEDPTQLMYPQTSSQTHGFSSGDLTGLAAMGSGKCAPGI